MSMLLMPDAGYPDARRMGAMGLQRSPGGVGDMGLRRSITPLLRPVLPVGAERTSPSRTIGIE